ncbi:MAG: DUF2723 domain-containing protein [Dysgonomonas sp.]
MKKYNLINNIFGWIAFAIAAFTYCSTIESSASFWDCGEFITSAYKLEVGHPPGAPFFMLTGKFFSLFATDPSHVAVMVNTMSALLSALTILFLFWTITHLTKKLVYSDKSKEISLSQTIIIMGSGLVGALAYTFSDTFWFSAVEGEVYAYSSMCTALVFWLILKWENRADKPGSDKWLVLIAYTMGLSIGVHLLNLLCLPAIVLVYYFKKKDNPDWKGTLLALAGSFGLVVVLMYGIIPGLVKVGGWFELFFVNSLGFSYNSGVLVYLVLFIGALVWSIYESFSKKGNLTRAKIGFIICMALAGIVFIGSNPLLWLILLIGLIIFIFRFKGVGFRMLNTSILCLFVIVVGYSTFALIPIRSAANTPMDQNSPEDAFTLASYLNREQYGDSPLFYGRTYASASSTVDGKYSSEKYGKVVKKSETEKDRYVVESRVPEVEYTNTMLFPRMHAEKGQPNYDMYMRGYANWGGVTNPNVPPTIFENLKFLFSYQLNYMYWRYFFWNFSGRQNDIQGRGGISSGNWITGIGFIDEHVLGLGPQDNLPPDIANNKGHNAFYMLPFILGVLGILYQLLLKDKNAKGKQQFWITFMLFFMTGIAIVLYLNQKPYEPRERDYAYAGSFYAFAIWIGLGVAGIWAFIKKYISEMPAAIASSVVCLGIPVQMATQTWDDHDRSGRYVMHDVAENYLKSCEPDAIIFTNGDNDTFPLWYIQEVEGYRTDVRVCNLSYLQTDWYVDQMRRQAYKSKPLPILWERDKYAGGNGNYAFVMSNKFIEDIVKDQMSQNNDPLMSRMQNIDYSQFYDMSVYKDTISLNEVMTNLRTHDKYTPFNKLTNTASIIPGTKLRLNINPDKVNWADLGTKPVSQMTIDISGKDGLAAYKSDLMILEMINNINNDNWKRPIYYATTVGSEMYMGLQPNFLLQGLTYRIVPGELPNNGAVNTEVTYDNLVNKFKYRGINDPKVYLDETNMRTCKTYRLMFGQLVSALLIEGKNDKVLKAVDKCMEVVPANTVPVGTECIVFADAYFRLGQKEKGQKLLDQISDRSIKTIDWFNRLNPTEMKYAADEMNSNIYTLFMTTNVEQKYNNFAGYNVYIDKLLSYVPIYYRNNISIYDRNGNLIKLGDYILFSLASSSFSNSIQLTDATTRSAEIKALDKIMQVMKQYNPEAYKQYTQQMQQEMQPQTQAQVSHTDTIKK